MFDVLIKNGKIVDGTGNPCFYGDVGILGDEIAKIGKIEEEAKRVIDAKGEVVSPGFCDIHTHSDYKCGLKAFEKDWSFSNWLLQGVTTLIASNCGQGIIPSEAFKGILLKTGFPREMLTDIEWDSVEDFIKLANKIGLGPNYVLLVGHWTLREKVLPPYPENKVTTKAQLQEMKDLLEEQMRAGVIGLSANFCYDDCRYAKKGELVELTKVVAKYGGILNLHTRGLYSHEAWLSGITEAIDIARKTGVPIEIAHLVSFEELEEGETPQVLKLIEEARKEGIDVAFDVIPYASHQYVLEEEIKMVLIGPPPRVAKSVEELAESWKAPEFREMVYQEMLNVGEKNPYEYVHCCFLHPDSILTNTDNPDIEGLTLGEIARVEGVTSIVTRDRRDILSLLVKLALEGCKGLLTFPAGIDWHQAELATAIFYDSPYSMPGSDGFLAERNATGAFARYFRDRVKRGVSLEEVVRHMTSLPTRRYVFDRGLLVIGQKADIVVFDPDNFKDNTTLADTNRKPSGIDFVLVNGSVVVENGEMTDARPGKVLLKH